MYYVSGVLKSSVTELAVVLFFNVFGNVLNIYVMFTRFVHVVAF